jgi:hypothetical protein
MEIKMKNISEVNQINELEMNQAIELTEDEMLGLMGGHCNQGNDCGSGISCMPALCPQ